MKWIQKMQIKTMINNALRLEHSAGVFEFIVGCYYLLIQILLSHLAMFSAFEVGAVAPCTPGSAAAVCAIHVGAENGRPLAAKQVGIQVSVTTCQRGALICRSLPDTKHHMFHLLRSIYLFLPTQTLVTHLLCIPVRAGFSPLRK